MHLWEDSVKEVFLALEPSFTPDLVSLQTPAEQGGVRPLPRTGLHSLPCAGSSSHVAGEREVNQQLQSCAKSTLLPFTICF